jgi:hypothetical protein
VPLITISISMNLKSALDGEDDMNGTPGPTEAPAPMEWREALEFIIRFAAIEDPKRLRVGELLNLIDDLRRYLEIEGDAKLAGQLAEVEKKPALLKGSIEIVRKLANAAVARQRAVIGLGETSMFDGTPLGDERGALLTDGNLKDSMADTVAGDLAQAESCLICRCGESCCGKLFLAARRGQVYCSHTCANNAASREYRASHAQERAERERSRYQRKRQPRNQATKKK